MNPAADDATGAAAIEASTLAWLGSALDDDSVSTEDNFLELGGHSLMAIELNIWMKETYGCELDVRLLFEDTLGKAIIGAVLGTS
jgi:acyl carrier protein